MESKRVYFIRHGETTGNAAGCFQTPETELSELGHTGAEALTQRVKDLEIDELLVSPYTRAQQTAEHIQHELALPIVTVETLHEIAHAKVIRGKRFDSEEGKAYLDVYEQNFRLETWKAEGAENFSDVIMRAEQVVGLLEHSPKKNILVVSHGNFLRSLVSYLLLHKNKDISMNLSVYNTLLRMSNVGITEFIYEDGEWHLFTWNDKAHFAE